MRQDPENEGRVRQIEDWEARGELEGEPQVKESMGWGTRVHGKGGGSKGPTRQKLGLCFLSSTIRW